VVLAEHASALAKLLDKTHVRACRAKKIRFKNSPGGTAYVIGRDFLDEAGNIDVRGASVGTGGVVTEKASVGFNQRLLGTQLRKLFR
jgi:hypothetical protein